MALLILVAACAATVGDVAAQTVATIDTEDALLGSDHASSSG